MLLSIKNSLLAGSLLLMVYSCNITRKYERPADTQTDNKLYRGVNSTDTVTIADIPWQQLFSDTVLQRLIQTGLANNYDLKIAVARMQSAVVDVKQSKLAFLPTLSATADATHSKTSAAQVRANGVNVSSIPANTIYDLTGSTSWEIDVWGKLRSTKRAYIAAFMKSEAYRRTVQTQLIANIAANYYQLLSYDKQIRIVEATIANRHKDVDIVRTLKESARVTGADVVNAEANLHSAELQLPDLKQQRRELENTLSTLLALPADSIARTTLDQQRIDSTLKTGLPAQLLANRPDVQEAEYSFRNAFELTNVARTYFYPSLSISGSAGWATANTLKDFFTGTFYGSIAGALTQPIFNQGLNKQRLQKAKATQQEAYYSFQNTLLTAGQEVSDALYAYDMAKVKETVRRSQIASLQKATDFTKELLKYSSNTNYTDVLTAEQNLLSAELSSVSDKLQQLQAVVSLYKALGGGWK